MKERETDKQRDFSWEEWEQKTRDSLWGESSCSVEQPRGKFQRAWQGEPPRPGFIHWHKNKDTHAQDERWFVPRCAPTHAWTHMSSCLIWGCTTVRAVVPFLTDAVWMFQLWALLLTELRKANQTVSARSINAVTQRYIKWAVLQLHKNTTYGGRSRNIYEFFINAGLLSRASKVTERFLQMLIWVKELNYVHHDSPPIQPPPTQVWLKYILTMCESWLRSFPLTLPYQDKLINRH